MQKLTKGIRGDLLLYDTKFTSRVSGLERDTLRLHGRDQNRSRVIKYKKERWKPI